MNEAAARRPDTGGRRRASRQNAFSETALMLGRRIDLLLVLAFASLERMAVEYRLGQMGTETNDGTSAPGGRA